MRTSQAKRGTQTSSFGTPGRINHDSTKFYESRLYDGLRNGKKGKERENEIPEKNIVLEDCNSLDLIRNHL